MQSTAVAVGRGLAVSSVEAELKETAARITVCSSEALAWWFNETWAVGSWPCGNKALSLSTLVIYHVSLFPFLHSTLVWRLDCELVDSPQGLPPLLQAGVLAFCAEGKWKLHDWLSVPLQGRLGLTPALCPAGLIRELKPLSLLSAHAQVRWLCLRPFLLMLRSLHLLNSAWNWFLCFSLKKVDLMILKMFAIFCNTKSVTFLKK